MSKQIRTVYVGVLHREIERGHLNRHFLLFIVIKIFSVDSCQLSYSPGMAIAVFRVGRMRTKTGNEMWMGVFQCS